MFFKFRSTGDKDFDAWVAKAKAEGKDLNQDAYLKLAEPTEAEPARYFKSYADGLYTKIIGLCTRPGQMCVSEMMAIDARGGQGGAEGEENYKRLQYDNHFAGAGRRRPAPPARLRHRPARPDAAGGDAAAARHGQSRLARGRAPTKLSRSLGTEMPNGGQVAPKQINQ